MAASRLYLTPGCLRSLAGECLALCTKGSPRVKRGVASLKLILTCAFYQDKGGREDHTNSNFRIHQSSRAFLKMQVPGSPKDTDPVGWGRTQESALFVSSTLGSVMQVA